MLYTYGGKGKKGDAKQGTEGSNELTRPSYRDSISVTNCAQSYLKKKIHTVQSTNLNFLINSFNMHYRQHNLIVTI